MKNLIKIVILMSLFIMISCTHPNYLCSQDSDCERKDNICVDGECDLDPCKERREDVCGKGKCIPGKLNDGKKYNSDYGRIYHCECDEEAVLIKNKSTSGFYFCSPKCDSYSNECVDFSEGYYFINYNNCNIPAGHCDTECVDGDNKSSCPKGQGCFSGVCDKATD